MPEHFIASIRWLDRFHAECTRQGVRVYFTHGVIPETRWRPGSPYGSPPTA